MKVHLYLHISTHLFVEGNLPITKVDSGIFNIIQSTRWGVPIYQVYGGGFYCHLHLENALKEKNCLNGSYSKRHYVVECTIPIGAAYYEGDYNGYPAFCTTKLIINKIIS